MGMVRTSAAFLLMAIILMPGVVTAAQEEFDIDLKELRHGSNNAKPHHAPQPSPPAPFEINLKELRRIAPPLAAKPEKHKRHAPAAAVPKAVGAAESGRDSIHVVQPGENLFIILMKRYGLTNQAAEKLIPEIMRLNGIASPQGLKIGQRLHIPLQAGNEKNIPAPHITEPEAGKREPAAAPDTTIPPPLPKPAAIPFAITSISVMSAPPCKLAHDIAEKMGLLVSTVTRIKGSEPVSATYASRRVIVVCGLSEAEQLTYERLLGHNGTQLLAFNEDDSDASVVEKLANQLGLVFRKYSADSAALPLTYIFSPFGNWSQELQLTIIPALPFKAY